MNKEFNVDVIVRDIKFSIKKNYKVTFLVAVFIISMIIGAAAVKTTNGELIKRIVTVYQSKRTNQSFLQTAVSGLLSALPLFLIVFFSGFYPLGAPVIVLAPVYKGLGTGLTMGYLYSQWGLKGVVYSFILIVPTTLIYMISMVFSCKEALRLSGTILRELTPKARMDKMVDDVKLYLKRFFAFFIIILLSCLVDLLLTAGFARFFQFG